VHKWRFLVFRAPEGVEQKLGVEEHLAMGRWWGEIGNDWDSHPKMLHKDVRRLSNDPAEGEVGAGADGWHIDGYSSKNPYLLNIMHFWEASEGGETWISPLKELVGGLDAETRALWEDLWFLTGDGKGKEFLHPLICKNSITGDPSMIFHCGAYKCWGLYRTEEKDKDEADRKMIDF
jgi:hypothetical protein